MFDYRQYERGYFMPPVKCNDWVNKEYVDKAPIWCSVDLRDGNQALVEPMSLDEKLEFFQMLVEVGFKEIEIGFPAASETEYEFCRTLIEKNMIPDDVTIQVLTQARPHIIKKTFEAVKGAPRAIVHVYNSTSLAQREQVFKKSKEEVKQIAIEGAKLLKELAEADGGNFLFEYSPESFTGTEPEYALDVCNAVVDIWQPTPDKKCIINLPATVEMSLPHVFASQIEYMSKYMHNRENVIISLHPHNDRSTGVADAELGLLAGADRIEGTLFGNGERTGNVDIITLAMNMYMQGVNPELNLSDMPHLAEVFERLTQMKIDDRHPWCGKLVFAAFSGSHQDAISKGMACKAKDPEGKWNVPYLPIDPVDVGRTYDSDVIRINSQSGKGGVSYILKQNFGLSIPEKMREEIGYSVKHVSDEEHKELSPEWVYQIFEDKYINESSVFTVPEAHFKQTNGIVAEVTIAQNDTVRIIKSTGNGRLDAVSNAFKQYFNISYELAVYEEHSLSRGSSSKAVSYVGINYHGTMYWGVGIDEDIIKSSIHALTVAVNHLVKATGDTALQDERLTEIINYINTNYLTVTLDELADQFHLSKPYLSKYIKDKSGKTFGELVKAVRMKKARTLLKGGNMTVEAIAENVGYQNVEHFNRLFKKKYGMTPVQFRNSKN